MPPRKSKFWEGKPILSWVVDDFDQLNNIMTQDEITRLLERYKNRSYNNGISKIVTNSTFSLNLGGQTQKNKLIATEKPIGVFNFSLASKTLFPLSEFFSEELKQKDPSRFAGLNLQEGIVPNILIKSIMIGGEKKYYYKDDDGVEFLCVKRVKGTTAQENGVPNAKLEYASKTKKVFQTYQKQGGKVRYVELYSLFYYPTTDSFSLRDDLQFSIRHLPAMMVAEYLESVGVKVRIYMTRFVELGNRIALRQNSVDNNTPLPLYQQGIAIDPNNQFESELLVQPIIAKEFQQEINNPLAYLISSESMKDIYEAVATKTFNEETTTRPRSLLGNPTFDQEQYWEGFERYKNKYQQYVELGLFKAKEVLPEAMILFHDQGIARNLKNFQVSIEAEINKTGIDMYLDPEVNAFFIWWMKFSANIIKHKINVINSNEVLKDLRAIKYEVSQSIADAKRIVETTQNQGLKTQLELYLDRILGTYNIMSYRSGTATFDFDKYINNIVDELNVFAQGGFYETSDEDIEKRLEFKQMILDELKKV